MKHIKEYKDIDWEDWDDEEEFPIPYNIQYCINNYINVELTSINNIDKFVKYILDNNVQWRDSSPLNRLSFRPRNRIIFQKYIKGEYYKRYKTEYVIGRPFIVWSDNYSQRRTITDDEFFNMKKK